MTTQHFSGVITRSGSRTLIQLPFNPDKVWGAKQRHHVTGSAGGCAIRGALEFDGKHYFLPIGAAWLRDSGLEVGTQVDVELSPEGPQFHDLAPDIARALQAEPQARAFFESLATFYRKTYIRWIEGAKRPVTRQARIAEMVTLLKAGKKQR